MEPLTPAQAMDALREADRLYTAQEVEAAYDRMAEAIQEKLADQNPLVLGVMIGGMIPAGHLVTRLRFPLQLDFVHVTRYRGGTQGQELHWRVAPAGALQDRTVLVIDDILDEGWTLAAILDYCARQGARAVYSAVLVEKQHTRKPVLAHADFCGLVVEDRYVFGCGMDYRSYLRNLPEIYAVKGL
jgi:hypoxanthine phosphoribosyltransferase